MNKIAFQDCYPDEFSHCFGCGKNNSEGHQLKSFWHENSHENERVTVARYEPKSCHIAIPGFVYGGLIASLIDCHGTGSAAAVAYLQENRNMTTKPSLRFVTAALNVNYLAPTPMGIELELIGRFTEVKAKKVIVDITVFAGDVVCAKGSVVAVKMPESMNVR